MHRRETRNFERLLRAGAVELRLASPDSEMARVSIRAYFDEISARFEEGFDPDLGKAGQDIGMSGASGAFVVAVLDGHPVGCGGVLFGPGAQAEIKRMWTRADARGLGIARRILRFLEEKARQAECRTVRLDTNRALVEAQGFYRADGFVEIPRYNDNPYAHHWFEKSLSPRAPDGEGRR